jgi:hypothetical protein
MCARDHTKLNEVCTLLSDKEGVTGQVTGRPAVSAVSLGCRSSRLNSEGPVPCRWPGRDRVCRAASGRLAAAAPTVLLPMGDHTRFCVR